VLKEKSANQEYYDWQSCPSERRRAKDIPRQIKAERICHLHTCLTRNAKGSSSSLNERILINSRTTSESTKLNGKKIKFSILEL
jgi:hypothetical protein